MSLTPKLLQQGAAGSARANYIEDVFSTYLYTGTGSSQTITNGIDLAGKGGLVWTKFRSGNIGTASHALTDTTRGVNKYLSSNSLNAETSSWTDTITAFNANGYTLGADAVTSLFNYYTATNYYTSWTFRKQAKFFDIVTYNGNSTASRQISHNLGSTPGCIIIKSTTGSTGGYPWIVWHRSLSTNTYLQLNTTDPELSSSAYVAAVSSTTFTINSSQAANLTGDSYVAYLFAHNAGGFGRTGSDNVITCESYTTDGSGTASVTLGWEPQFLLVKRTQGIGQWVLLDTMRGAPVNSVYQGLAPNSSNAETGRNFGAFTATGFTVASTGSDTSAVGETYIYIAIRRGPMKVPTTGTSVFNSAYGTSTVGSFDTSFPVDMGIYSGASTATGAYWSSRLTSNKYMNSFNTNAEGTFGSAQYWDRMEDWFNSADSRFIGWGFRRAPGFFDVVCYDGTSTNRYQNHSLGVVPELIFVKCRNSTAGWLTYSATLGPTQYLRIEATDGTISDSTFWNDLSPTTTAFSLGLSASVNSNSVSQKYIAYLFASCPGVSKVGSYTGNGSTQTIDCGFAAGARFVLIKRTDSGGDWYVFDTTRGIIAGNDPFLKMNTTGMQVSSYDAVDPANAGFIVNNDDTNYPINVASATYIFLAIA